MRSAKSHGHGFGMGALALGVGMACLAACGGAGASPRGSETFVGGGGYGGSAGGAAPAPPPALPPSGGGASAPQAPAPRVVEVRPAPDEVAVAIGVVVEVSFSADMDPASIDASSLALSLGGVQVVGDVAYADRLASFSPAEALEYGALYLVRVASSVRDVRGRPLGLDVSWSFRTAERPPSRAGFPRFLAPGSAVDMASDGRGNAAVVWLQDDHVAASRYVAGAGFDAVVRIDASQGRVTDGPHVAIDGWGGAVVVWAQESPDASGAPAGDGSRAHVFAARAERGGGWQAAQRLDPLSVGLRPNSVRVAVSHVGDGVAVWCQDDAAGAVLRRAVFASRLVAGAWAEPQVLDDPFGAGESGQPDVAMDAGGEGVVVWVRDGSLRGNRLVGGAFAGPEPVDGGAGIASAPRVALNGRGEGLVVWERLEGSYQGVFASRVHPAAGFAPALAIDAGPDPAYAPQVALDEQGAALVVYERAGYVLASGLPPGAAAGAPVLLGQGWVPDVAVRLDGRALAAWEDPSGVAAALGEPGFAWRPSVLLGPGRAPRAGVVEPEGGLAVWESQGSILFAHVLP